MTTTKLTTKQAAALRTLRSQASTYCHPEAIGHSKAVLDALVRKGLAEKQIRRSYTGGNGQRVHNLQVNRALYRAVTKAGVR